MGSVKVIQEMININIRRRERSMSNDEDISVVGRHQEDIMTRTIGFG